MTISITGKCHCGQLRYQLDWPDQGVPVAARRCGCSFCVSHGAAWTSHRDATLQISVRDRSGVSRYTFGTGTAQFLVCRTCGGVPIVISEIDERQYAVVNVNTFTPGHGLNLTVVSTNFDQEDTASRLDRRAKNWIPAVQIGQVQ